MPLLRQLFLPLLIPALLTGCVAASPADIPPSPVCAAQPGARADVTYAYLQLEQAMRRDDAAGVQEAVQTLLLTDPQPRPLADAAGWLLGNRYSGQARELLETAVTVLPDDLQLRIILAEIMLDEDDMDGAVSVLQAFADAHPENASARMELALLYLKADRSAEALTLFGQLPASECNPTVRYYHAQALKSVGRLADAAAMLRGALNEAPDFLEAILELALIEEQRGRYSTARSLYETLLTYDEGNQDILLRLVGLCLKEGNPDRAYSIASGVPDSLGFVLTATSQFMDEGRSDLAAALLARLAKNTETPPEIALYQAAVAYENEKNAKKALKFLERIPPDNRHYSKALKLKMQILFESGQLDEALTTVAQAEDLYPGDQELRYAHMEMLMRHTRFDEAEAVARQAMEQWPDDANLAFQRAYLVDAAGDKTRGLDLMESVIERWPDNAQALNYVGYTLADDNRDLLRALDLLNRAVELSPETDYMLDSLAWVNYRLGHYQEAWEHIRHAVSLLPPDKPQDATMWEHYGDIAHALKLKDEAHKGWKRALELKPADTDSIRRKLEQI
ncbi:MAG: tetratricopeptide repeat protein [Desulfovibrionaceae bacterium]|nr:tetratricopeptide repeat protein [Desulfovibrionaceae bacterium]